MSFTWMNNKSSDKQKSYINHFLNDPKVIRGIGHGNTNNPSYSWVTAIDHDDPQTAKKIRRTICHSHG